MSNNCFGNYTTTGAAGPSVCNPAPVCCSPAEPPETEAENESTETCSCRDSLAAALQLLCSGDLPALIDFNRFAFLASSYLIGSYLVCPCGQTGTYDNLADTLTGSFNRFTPCSCELIDVSGQVYDAIPYYRPQTVANLFTVMSENLDGVEDAQGTINALAALAARIDPGSADFRPDLLEAFQPLLGACSCPNVSISEVSLCALDAIAFDAAGATPEQQAASYQAAKQTLLQILRPKCPPPCHPCQPPKPKPCVVPPNCRNNGILSSMDRCGMAHTVSLTAGNLLLVGASLLGSIGNTLVLSNDADGRFYFICSEKIEFIS